MTTATPSNPASPPSARPSCFGGCRTCWARSRTPIAERSFLRQLFNGAQPFVNCGGADPVHSELTARLRADYGATRSQETGSKARWRLSQTQRTVRLLFGQACRRLKSKPNVGRPYHDSAGTTLAMLVPNNGSYIARAADTSADGSAYPFNGAKSRASQFSTMSNMRVPTSTSFLKNTV